MDKVLEALEDLFQATSPFIEAKDIDGLHMSNCYNIIEKELKEKIELNKIQDELGIDLVTLFKAMKKGFFDKDGEYHHSSNLLISLDEIGDYYDKIVFNLKDYGKTWALDKKDLMKEELE